jgi:hypothetical protein
MNTDRRSKTLCDVLELLFNGFEKLSCGHVQKQTNREVTSYPKKRRCTKCVLAQEVLVKRLR